MSLADAIDELARMVDDGVITREMFVEAVTEWPESVLLEAARRRIVVSPIVAEPCPDAGGRGPYR